LSNIFVPGWTKAPKFLCKKSRRSVKRILNLLVSDTHFGSHLVATETPHEYGTIQESRRLGEVAKQVAEYKQQYRDETKLIIHFLGDIIQGVLHDQREGEVLTHQFATAVQYLTQLVLFACANFPQVEVYCTTGNHGRNPSRHPFKAVDEKWDSIETMIYCAVRTAVLNSGVTNCSIFIPKTPYYTVSIFGNKGFFTHGDTVLRPGFPSRSIAINSLAQQIAKWNTARDIGGPFQLFACGHVHTASITTLPGRVSMVTNGCLVPTDKYAISIGIPDITCGQYMIESVEKYIVGDTRLILVDEADGVKANNDIIKPFAGI
jgi:hypothetical protein